MTSYQQVIEGSSASSSPSFHMAKPILFSFNNGASTETLNGGNRFLSQSPITKMNLPIQHSTNQFKDQTTSSSFKHVQVIGNIAGTASSISKNGTTATSGLNSYVVSPYTQWEYNSEFQKESYMPVITKETVGSGISNVLQHNNDRLMEDVYSQIVLLSAENERLSYAYLEKTQEVNDLQAQMMMQKSELLNSRAQQTVQQQQGGYLGQADMEAKMRMLSTRNEALHMDKIQMQTKEFEFSHKIDSLMKNLNIAHSQIEALTSQLASHLDQSQSSAINEQLIQQKNQEIKDLRLYAEQLEKDVEVIQEKFREHEWRQDEQKYSLHDNVQSVMARYAEQTEQLYKRQSDIELILSENEQLQTALLERIAENEALKEEIQLQSRGMKMSNEDQQNVELLRREIIQLREQSERSSFMIGKANVSALTKKDKQMNDVHIELDNLKAALQFKEQIISQLNRKVDEIIEESNRLQDTANSYTNCLVQCKELERKMSSLSEECNDWRKKYQKMEELQGNLISDVKVKVRNQLAEEFEIELSEVREKLESIENLKATALSNVSSLEQKLALSEMQLREAQKRVQSREEDTENAQKDRVTKKQRIKLLDKQLYSVQEKLLLLNIENERLHNVQGKLLQDNEELRWKSEQSLQQSRCKVSEAMHRASEAEEVNISLKIAVQEYQSELARLEKSSHSLKLVSSKVAESDEQISHLSREVEQLRFRLIETENNRNELKAKCTEFQNILHNYQQTDLQLTFMTKENERLQAIIMQRCRQSQALW